MAKFLGTDISGLIHKHLSPIIKDATLIQVTSGARTPADLAGGKALTETSKTAKGFVNTYRDYYIDGKMIRHGDRKILLTADSIEDTTVPTPGDKITIEGTTYVIQANGVSRDPASATYICHGRPV